MKIRVCDDETEMADEWVTKIRSVISGEFEISNINDATKEISNLLMRKITVDEGGNPSDIDSEFDSIDILVVDYDLVHLDADGGRTTGEGIARLARSYSRCGAIAVMNQFKGPQFDLGMRGHLDSFADVNLDANLINSPALWRIVSATENFNPTTWRPLPRILNAGRQLSEQLEKDGLDTEITSILGLNEDAIAHLSDTAFGFLDMGAKTTSELAAVPLRSFLERSLDARQVTHLAENAYKFLYDFAAYRLMKWLDRAVLRPMDVLIDAPHLIDRLPFLIDVEKIDQSNHNDWAEAASSPTALLRWNELESFHNKKASAILGRDVFDWYRMVDDDRIEELQDKYLDLQDESPRFFLAEDTSRFVEREKLTRYRADFHNFGDRRGIENIKGITYGPLRRMRFG